MSLSEDALVAVCLCTRLGRGAQTPALDAQAWTALVLALQERGLTPRALLERDADRFGQTELLRGLGSAGMEVERLEATGVWVLTRGDTLYPVAWKRKLGPAAPPVLFGAGPRAALNARLVALLGKGEIGHALAALCAAGGWGVVAEPETIDAEGFGVTLPTQGLERAIARKRVREAILQDRLTLVTPALPGEALPPASARRLACALARYACVLGGDAADALRDRSTPVYVRTGHRALREEGALLLREPLATSIESVFSDEDPPSGAQAEFDF